MVFKEDNILVVPSVDRWGIFFVIREHGPDVVFELRNGHHIKIIKGWLTPKEHNYIIDNIIFK